MMVRRGNTIVKIYRTPTKGCDSYTVVHYLGDKRQRKTFANLELAVTEAEMVATKLSTGQLDVLMLTSNDRFAFMRAVEALKPTGVPLEIAALQFAEAVKVLEGGSLLEAAELEDYFSGRRKTFEVPIDFRFVTPFQERVLRATARIPFGSVSSYGEIARQIGKPEAQRAVGGALGHNPVPIIIPCHRVIAANGSIGGYTGGLEIKRELFKIEGISLKKEERP